MGIRGAFVVPHPPIIVPSVGKGEEKQAQATIDAFHRVGKRIAELNPDLLVFVTPHGELYRDAFHITVGRTSNAQEIVKSRVWGDFAEFRDPSDPLEFALDDEFIEMLIRCADKNDPPLPYVAAPLPNNKLDHGCMVPLHFISQYVNIQPNKAASPCKIARLAVSLLDEQTHWRMGACIAQALAELDKQGDFRRTIIIASGDLSHTGKGSHYGYNPAGPVFDQHIIKIFAEGTLKKLMDFEENLRNDAAECGLNPCIVMSGALHDSEFDSHVLSYEAPWGIGYGVASFIVTQKHPVSFQPLSSPLPSDACESSPSLPVRLALAVLDDLFTGYKAPDDTTPAVSEFLTSLNAREQAFCKELYARQAGCFVSFHTGANLRGCIGTITATCTTLFEEICHNTVSSALRDPRFPALRKNEVSQLTCSVDILGEAEVVTDRSTLDAKRFGVIVTAGLKRGVLLPDLEGVETPEQQIEIALQKADISPHQPYELERFEVIRYE